jgi:hypothetical protein
MGHPLWREDGSVIYLYNCFWTFPEQRLLVRSPQNSRQYFLYSFSYNISARTAQKTLQQFFCSASRGYRLNRVQNIIALLLFVIIIFVWTLYTKSLLSNGSTCYSINQSLYLLNLEQSVIRGSILCRTPGRKQSQWRWHARLAQVVRPSSLVGGSLFVKLKLEPFSYTFTSIVNTAPEEELKSANLRTSGLMQTSAAIEYQNKTKFNLARCLLRIRFLQQLLLLLLLSVLIP